ncbi:hypothetical protein [Xylella fastidiosa]|uniref:hypothetical protein n=1 Tax=Xylella fastidiosa TaxID=2371 RepID=UPI0012BA780A|nr:hypothetical protein [Xylella fastidiosa]MDG5823162.1 hypothetical protein [Xylella fastidiosa subsp. pauca]MDG5826433.1 hypothetical protein [Xylella fastidiosa subsp. pauca]
MREKQRIAACGQYLQHAPPSTPSVAAPVAALPTCSVDDLWARLSLMNAPGSSVALGWKAQ